MVAELVGTLADRAMEAAPVGEEDSIVCEGNMIIATENFSTKVFAANELATFTACRRGQIFERLIIPLPSYLPVAHCTSHSFRLS